MAWDSIAVAIATVASAVFAGASAWYAARSAETASRVMAMEQQSQASQLVLQQAELSLKWAWEALTDKGQHLDPPQPDRLNWLTAARHILRYKELKEAITAPVHKDICEDREEFWRHLFYQALSSKAFYLASYFEEKTPKQNGIHPQSAVVVFAFSKWPNGKIDPIDDVDIKRLVEGTTVLDGKPGLRHFLTSKGLLD